MAEQDVVRYVEKKSLEDTNKENLLTATGLSSDFPIFLRELNDVLAAPRPDQLLGFSITLVPGKDPQPLLETRYHQGRTIKFDIQTNRHEPLESIATLHIGNGFNILSICTLEDVQEFAREAFINQPVSLKYSVVNEEDEENPKTDSVTVNLSSLDNEGIENLPLSDLSLVAGDQLESRILLGKLIDSRYKQTPIEIKEVHIVGKSGEITEKLAAVTKLLQKDFYRTHRS